MSAWSYIFISLAIIICGMICYEKGKADGFKDGFETGERVYHKYEELGFEDGQRVGAREFAEWLPQHFDLRFDNNPDAWLDEFFNHTREKVLAEWQKEKQND